MKYIKTTINAAFFLFVAGAVFANQIKVPSKLKVVYSVIPDLEKGKIGVLSEEEKKEALNEVNAIRRLHKLPPVIYNNSYQFHMDKAALIIAGKGKLTHFPVVSDKFYSKEGAFGCSHGNLFLEKHTILSFKKTDIMLENLDVKKVLNTLNPKIATAKEIIHAFLIDEKVTTLGHRRWLLNPFLTSTAFGRVDGFTKKSRYHFVTAAALKVVEHYKNKINDNYHNKLPDFVAYPFENYPFRLFRRYWFMSFSVIVDKQEFWENKKVDFKTATISITDEFGNKVEIFGMAYNNYPTGLPNCLQWKAKHIKLNRVYFVTVSNVLILSKNTKSKFRTYRYWFKLEK
jgi:hypothetical protein